MVRADVERREQPVVDDVIATGAVLDDRRIGALRRERHRIGIGATVDAVIPRTAGERVVTGAAGQRAGAADMVISGAAIEHVVAQQIVDHVIACTGGDAVIAGAAGHRVTTVACCDRVVAGARIDQAAIVASFDRIIAAAADDRVQPTATNDRVVTCAGRDAVATAIAVEEVEAVAGQDDIVACAAMHFVLEAAGVDGIVAVIAENLVVLRSANDGVVACAGVDDIGPRQSIDRLAAGTAENGVVARTREVDGDRERIAEARDCIVGHAGAVVDQLACVGRRDVGAIGEDQFLDADQRIRAVRPAAAVAIVEHEHLAAPREGYEFGDRHAVLHYCVLVAQAGIHGDIRVSCDIGADTATDDQVIAAPADKAVRTLSTE